MPLSKDKKQEIVDQVSGFLGDVKIVVLAHHDGVSVKAMQDLRRQTKGSGTKVRVIKNNLFIKAMDRNEKYKDIERSIIEGQLLYAFNNDDEIAPAQALDAFAKSGQKIEFVGAITSDGNFIGSDDIKAMANLPSKEQLRAMLVGTLSAPLSGFVGVLRGNLTSLLSILNNRANSLN